VTPHVYSSMEAFLTYWRALAGPSAKGNLSDSEGALLAAIDDTLRSFPREDRAALLAPEPEQTEAAGTQTRRRRRAESRLRALLIAAGWLQP
jgi:hypothetical protein